MKSGNSKEDLLVSIILSESTTSMLKLDIQAIEDVSETCGSMCIIMPVNKSDIIKSYGKFLSLFTSKPYSEDIDGISEETAYFSECYRSDSNASVSSLDEIDDLEEEDYQMQSVSLYTRPLVTAKTLAHDDRIHINNNEICVSLVLDEIALNDSEYICRICHGGESLGDLSAPCKCKGTIALAHMECLEHWLRESTNSYCELCQHHYRIIRQPRYAPPWSILMYILTPGEHWRDVLTDTIAFIIYTPSAFFSTYLLMLICDNIAKSPVHRTRNFSAHVVAFCAVFGMAAIDFTYSSWLLLTFQRQVSAWKSWCRNHSYLKIILPEWRRKPFRIKQNQGETSRSK